MHDFFLIFFFTIPKLFSLWIEELVAQEFQNISRKEKSNLQKMQSTIEHFYRSKLYSSFSSFQRRNHIFSSE